MFPNAKWIMPIPGTDWKKLEDELAKVKIMGDRYPADQQAQVGK